MGALRIANLDEPLEASLLFEEGIRSGFSGFVLALLTMEVAISATLVDAVVGAAECEDDSGIRQCYS